MKWSQSKYRNDYAFIQGLSQEDALGFYQQIDQEVKHTVQWEAMETEGLEPSGNVYPQNPCQYGFVFTGIKIGGKLLQAVIGNFGTCVHWVD